MKRSLDLAAIVKTGLALVVVFGLAWTIALQQLPDINPSTVTISGTSLDSLVDIAQFVSSEKDYQVQLLKFLLTDDVSQRKLLLERADQARRQANHALTDYSENTATVEDRSAYTRLLADWKADVDLESTIAKSAVYSAGKPRYQTIAGNIDAVFVKTGIDSGDMLDWSISLSRSHDRSASLTSAASEIGIVIVLIGSLFISVRLFKRYDKARKASVAAEQEAILRSEERFRSILRNSSDVVLIANAKNIVEYASPSCSAQWGYDDWLVRDASCLQFVHPDDVSVALSALQRAIETPGDNVTAELRLQCSGHDFLYHEVIVNDLSDDSGVRGIVWTFRNITERKTFEKKLSHQAFHDVLTGLPNRALFLDRLERALKVGKPVAVMFLDIDNFKLINDSLGHDAGDRLLIGVSKRLLACARQSDTVCRLGGDEFTVLIEDLVEDSDHIDIAERIANALREPMYIDGREVITTASIGVTVSTAGHDDSEAMLRDADTAMYQAKSDGKSRFALFDSAMNVRVKERLDTETDLRRAVENNEFELHYQPIVGIDSGLIDGIEALIRWRHPERGLIPPASFIPVAEETGMIIPIGRWVLFEACRKTREFQSIYNSGLSVNINLSARQLQDAGLVGDVQEALRISGLSPSRLKLEITESLTMTDRGGDIKKLNVLKSLGVRLAIDDFGTGYSSMSYLSTLPIDTIKIDRVFVSRLSGNTDDDAIVQAIIGLAKTLHLEVVGEGVETLEQHERLAELSCDLGQGYYYSKPIPEHGLIDLLKSYKANKIESRLAA